MLPGGAGSPGDASGGGVLAASNAAAAAMAVSPLPRPQGALAPAAAPAPIPIPRVEVGTVLHLLWFDTDAVPRMRRKPEWRKILNDFDQRPLDPEIDDPALAKEPMDVEDRREVFEILAQGEAFADDWVILAGALLDVFELTADPAWLSDAITLMEETERGFADPAHGGYFLTADHHEKLLLRDKPDYDGPIPSASSVAALVWLRLHAFTGDDRFRTRAESTVRAFSGVLSSRPLAMDHMLLALDWATDAVKEVVIVVPEGRGALSPAARPLLDVLARAFAPNLVLAVGTEADMQGALGQRLAWAADKRLRDGRATAYVCERGACKLPTNDPAVLAAQLAEARPY
ncbi:MAG: hypothetical protein U0359_31525 [Byssovorax sp.]